MTILSCSPYIYDTLMYFYGRDDYADIFMEICVIVNYNLGGKENLFLRGNDLTSIYVTKAGIDTIVYDGESSQNEALAIIILELCGAAYNTIYNRVSAYRSFSNYTTYVGRRKLEANKPIDEGADKYFNISVGEQRDCMRIPGYDSGVMVQFCLLVGCYLKRVPTIEDLSGKVSLPIVKTQKGADNVEQVSKGLPTFIAGYITDRIKADRVMMDSSVNSKYFALRNFVYDMLGVIHGDLAEVVKGSLFNVFLHMAYSIRPKSYDFEKRYIWYLNCLSGFKTKVIYYYGTAFDYERSKMKAEMCLTEGDYLHSVETYFEESILALKEDTKNITFLKEIILKVNEIVIEFHSKETNLENVVGLYPVACLLIYGSIYGTNRMRRETLIKRFSVTISGELIELEIATILPKIYELSRSHNVFRLWARHYSSLTLWLRKTNNIFYNIWGKFYDVPQYLCYDTVNYCGFSILEFDERVAVLIISKWIRDCTRRSGGRLLSTLAEKS